MHGRQRRGAVFGEAVKVDVSAIQERYYGRVSHVCDQANEDIGKLLRLIAQGPPLPPAAVLHDAASAIDVARVCYANGETEQGDAELKRASSLLRELVAT